MYLMDGEMYPKLDPITGRTLCRTCWDGAHERCGEVYNAHAQILCDHFTKQRKSGCTCTFECDCHHISEAYFADVEKKKVVDNRAAKKALLSEMLEDESNPLRAIAELQPKNNRWRHA